MAELKPCPFCGGTESPKRKLRWSPNQFNIKGNKHTHIDGLCIFIKFTKNMKGGESNG